MSIDRRSSKSPQGPIRRMVHAIGTGGLHINPFRTGERDDSPQHAWRRTVRSRTLLTVVVLALWITGVQARLVYLQVVRHDHYVAAAARHQNLRVELEAPRGDIVDRNGDLLAYSVKARAIFADPREITEPEATAAAVCRALGDCTAAERRDLLDKLQGPRQFYYIRRSHQASPAQVSRIAALNLPGIHLQSDTGRFYPFGTLAAHVIGFVGQDNTGQAGLEHAYDRYIQGEPGLAFSLSDTQRVRVQPITYQEPVPGATLELTLDSRLQYLVERELEAGVEASRARAGTAIVMNPRTGEILALASYPTFNPNRIGDSLPNGRRNRAVQDIYEPGSTFKVITAAAAIQERIVTRYELIDTNPGWMKFKGRKAITEVNSRNYGVLTFEDSIIKSSNIGAIKVGLRTGVERLTSYVTRFGFGDRIAPDFPGESRGIWNPRNLNDSGLASISMGYQIGVTPMQMAAAISAVANGGLLMEPRVVRAIVRDGVREVVQPKVLRRVIDERTAATVAGMMGGVVARGTAKGAVIEGYPAAGKTGTAHKVAEGGGYSRSDYNASFAGFLPLDDPELTILVVIDSPRTSIYGGTVAAPVFRKIAEGALQHLGIAPTGEDAPRMTVRTGSVADSQVRTVRVSDRAPSLVHAGGPALMPDLRGMSAREALRVLTAAGLSAQPSGTGFVQAQVPEAGTPVDPGSVGVLVLRRDAALREEDTR